MTAKKVKVLSTKEPELVFDYLLKNKTVMPRVVYRYALEKIKIEQKREKNDRTT